MNSLLTIAPLAFFATSPQPCPYLPNRFERRLVTDLSRRDAIAVHDALSQAGFRRSHTLAYAPICQGCSACVPVRVDSRNSTPGRAHRRVLARNADLALRQLSPVATREHYKLFMEYQKLRHHEGEMAKMGFHDYQALIEQTPVRTGILEARTGSSQLVAVSIFDVVADGLSAVYSFYDATQTRRSLGTFMILAMIDLTRTMALHYLYLGFWIAQTTKMSYKARFRPLQVLTDTGWRTLNADDADLAPST